MNVFHILIIFSITALLGGTLLNFVLNNKKRPMFIVALHGIFALFSIGTLYYYIGDETMDQKHAPVTSSVFFGLAAIGGIYMLVLDKVLSQSIPKWMPFIHAGAAVTGYVLLWIHALSR
jgi:hypothetical protein